MRYIEFIFDEGFAVRKRNEWRVKMGTVNGESLIEDKPSAKLIVKKPSGTKEKERYWAVMRKYIIVTARTKVGQCTN